MLSQSFLNAIKRYVVVLDKEDKHIRDFECVVGFGKEQSEVLSDCFVDCINALMEDSQFVLESYNYDSIRYNESYEFPRLQLYGRYYMPTYNSIANCGKLLMLLSKNMPNIRFTMKDMELIDYSLQYYGTYGNYHIPSSQVYVDISIDEQRFPQLVKTVISKFEKFTKPFQW